MKKCEEDNCCKEVDLALMHKDIKSIKRTAYMILISILIPVITGIVIGVTVSSINKAVAIEDKR